MLTIKKQIVKKSLFSFSMSVSNLNTIDTIYLKTQILCTEILLYSSQYTSTYSTVHKYI